VKSVQEQALAMAAKKARISFFAGVSKEDPYIKFDSNIVHYKEVSVLVFLLLIENSMRKPMN